MYYNEYLYTYIYIYMHITTYNRRNNELSINILLANCLMGVSKIEFVRTQ